MIVRLGDQWTFVAIDAETKLVPAYRVGKRTRDHAVAFMTDLSERLSNRVQISSDSLRSYVEAVEQAFGADVDYGQIVKFYDAEPIGPGRYPLQTEGVTVTSASNGLPLLIRITHASARGGRRPRRSGPCSR